MGLTQLRDNVFVYNKKRHGDVKLSNRTYRFKVKLKGYPKELTKEYLLVDLVNNLDEVGESPSMLLKKVADSVQANEFNNTQLTSKTRLTDRKYIDLRQFFFDDLSAQINVPNMQSKRDAKFDDELFRNAGISLDFHKYFQK